MKVKAFYSVAELARELDCHPDTVRKYCDANGVKRVKVGKLLKIPCDEVYEANNGLWDLIVTHARMRELAAKKGDASGHK